VGYIERCDGPGVWHHVYHRGASQRAVFERRADLRYFLALLARAVHRGEVAIIAYALVTNHFHLLLQSLIGRLSHAMKRILNAYVRYFNRTRRRDGSLFGGRFKSKPVLSNAYRRILVPYIDENPVKTGLVERAQDYPWCSAFHYARRHGPIWMARSWIESEVSRSLGTTDYDPAAYVARFGRPLPEAVRTWVRRRLHGKIPQPDSLDDLLAAAAYDVREWLRWRARVADGTTSGLSLVPAEWVEETVRLEQALDGDWTTPRGVTERGCTGNAWRLVLPALLRDVGGLSQMEISLRLKLARSTVQHQLHAHLEAMQRDPAYADRCGRIARAALDRLRDL
jgi:REP element-mobilizing transposase RayT